MDFRIFYGQFWFVIISVATHWLVVNSGQPTPLPNPAARPTGRPPRILEHPSDLIVPKNEPATLQCKADGDPSPQILWYKDHGEIISSSSGSSGPTISPADAESPRLIQQNGALHFSRVVHNKKGRPDAGMYWCVAKNSLGEVRSRNATLQVAVLRDEFRRQPNSNIQVAAGDTALLECQPPRGSPEPRVFWKRDGKELKATGRFALMDEGNLVITEVRPSDAGKYICVAENPVGIKESHAAVLTVNVKPSLISPPQDITAKAEENVIFECKVTGDPDPTVTWRKKDGRWPLKDSRISLQEDRSLRIEKVSPSDEGVYECNAENIAGSVSGQMMLTVHSRPSFLVTPRDQRVAEHGEVSFDCLITGNPPPAFWWMKEGTQVLMFPGQPHGRFAVQTDGTLIINSVKKEDTGYYVCSVMSVAGSAMAKAYLEVSHAAEVPPPVIKLGPANQTLALNSIAMLPCQASDILSPTIQWYKDAAPLSMNSPRLALLDSGTLQISDLQASDSGIYTCIASSDSGETPWSAALIVEAPTNPNVVFHRMPDISTFPGPPSKPQVVNVSETFVEITWRSPLNEGASAVTGYRVEYFSFDIPMGWVVAADSVTGNSLNIAHLRPDTSYIFLIRAINSHGISLPSVMSEPIRTQGNIRPLPDYDLADIKLKFNQQLVELTEVKAISSTAVNLYWNILRNDKYIAGYLVKFRPVGGTNGNGNGYSMVSIRKGSAQTHTLLNLKKFTKYEFILVPVYKDIRGTPSNIVTCQTLEDAPDEPPRDIHVHLVNLTAVSITWQPPSPDRINGRLLDYRLLIALANTGSNTSAAAAAMNPFYVRNLTISAKESRSEIVANLTSGMRYKIIMAARTEAGFSEMSKPVFIKMERIIQGTADFLREPWFIGLLGGVVLLLLLIICGMFYHRRKSLAFRHKNYPPQHIQQMGIPFHPGMQTNTTILPDSSVILGRRPPIGYTRNSPWIHPDSHNCSDWSSQHAEQKETLLSSFDIPLGSYSPADAASPYATATLAMQKQQQRCHHLPVNPPKYNEIEEDNEKKRKYHYENNACLPADHNSSLSSRSHQSHPETLSVHSHRSGSSPRSARSNSQPQKPATYLPTLNWADILPPPPKCPPPPPPPTGDVEPHDNDGNSNQDDYSSLYYDDNGTCTKCGGEGQGSREAENQRPEPPPRNPKMIPPVARERISSDRSEGPAKNGLRMLADLGRVRSFESSVNGEGDLRTGSTADFPSDTEYGDGDADEENEDDPRSRESSPCLSSEASFFLDTDASRAAATKNSLASARHRDQSNNVSNQSSQRTHLLQQYPRPSPHNSPFVRHNSLRHDATANGHSSQHRDPALDRHSRTAAKRPNRFE